MLASETNGDVTRNAAGTLAVDPGLYSGPVGGNNAALSLSTEATGNGGGSKSVDGRDTGYFVETRFNALNERIATNAETGLWREFDLDANGNVIATHNFGTDGMGDALTSYSAYDGRNRETARFDVAAPVAGQSGDVHAVTRMEYDVQDNLVRQVGPDGHTTQQEWNALGSLISET
ncbi:YD repeat-containing protein, partial [Marinobacter sp. MBR-99]